MDQHFTNLNWFDITIISILAISTLFAVFRGFIRAVFSLATWVASSIATTALYPFILPYFATRIHSEKLAMITAFLVGFLVIFIILSIIISFIINALGGITGGVVDRCLGFIFGAARGILIVCLIFFSISFSSKMLHLGSNQEKPGPDFFAKAATYEILDTTTTRLLAFAPEDMPSQLEKVVEKFKDITVSAMGAELEASSSSSKTLSDSQRQLMKKIIATLPKEDIADIYKKNDGDTTNISEDEKAEIFKEMLEKYKGYEKNGTISADKSISDEALKELEKALSVKPKDEEPSDDTGRDGEVGYKEHNIKQLDKLIDGVK